MTHHTYAGHTMADIKEAASPSAVFGSDTVLAMAARIEELEKDEAESRSFFNEVCQILRIEPVYPDHAIADVLRNRIGELEKDAARLSWLEEQVSHSRTGVSIDYACHVEDGYVEEKGYRFMWWHFLGERKKDIRKAIDAAMEADK